MICTYTSHISIGPLQAEISFKAIRNVHLSVHPPYGKIKVAAPKHMALDTVRIFVLSELAWIKAQRQQFLGQARETAREYCERESHYVWGRRYLLSILINKERTKVELKYRKLLLTIPSEKVMTARETIIARWYRQQLKARALPLIDKWAAILNVKVSELYIQRMKTKWGSCSPHRQSIRLNTELAKKPPACLEYIIIHEMIHLLEPTHNARFQYLMNQFLPNWEERRKELNRLPLGFEEWGRY